jgi:hypothetical protein
MSAAHGSYRHLVQFYDDDAALVGTVAAFLRDGFLLGEPALVIARPQHREGISRQLAALGMDVATAKRFGDFQLLDAEDTLALFMVDAGPDPTLFSDQLTTIFEQVAATHPGKRVRAYGEMDDVLWQRGEVEAAIRVEVLWNELALTHRFSLLCGYAVGHFFKQSTGRRAVCEHHTHLVDGPADLPFDRRLLRIS